MLSLKALVFAGALTLPLTGVAAPAPPGGLPAVSAQADATAAAEQAVSDARAALRRAMSLGKGLKEARAGLAASLKALDQAKLGAGQSSAAATSDQASSNPPVAAPAAGSAMRPSASATPPENSASDRGRLPVSKPGVPVVFPSDDSLAIGRKTADGRVIVRANGILLAAHDEDARLAASGGRVAEEDAGNGEHVVTVDLPDGSQAVTLRDRQGNVVRRTIKLAKGGATVLTDVDAAIPHASTADRGALEDLTAPSRFEPGVHRSVIDGGSATPEAIEAALAAPPGAAVERSYAIGEVRADGRLRNELGGVDIDTLHFAEGQATLPAGEAAKLAAIGRALATMVAARPDEIFLVEGHTDAVGSDLANLLLSDRRAETVAEILTRDYGVPAENLVTQGYGEQYLKVPTHAAEPRNRRITIRRITPLLGMGSGA
jgi:outer membrane protein OmpA-like peptidoglycan-associated protein